jgi:hypothetical protein
MSIQMGVYEHYKGNKYLVIGIAKNSETLEEMVIYISLYDNPVSKMWARPLKMFLGNIMVDGIEKPRFKFLNN